MRAWRYWLTAVSALSILVFSGCAQGNVSPIRVQLPAASAPCQDGSLPIARVAEITTLYGELCTPPSGPTNTVMVIVSGLTYSHLYWDWPSTDGVDYSAMHYYSALDRQGPGYSTFSFDRPGIGLSSHPESSAITVESNVAVLHQLIERLRAGPIAIGPAHPFAHIILIGHSFGSVLASQEAATFHDVDAVVLTGELHRQNSQIAPLVKTIAASKDPSHRFNALGTGYLTSAPGSIGPLFYSGIGVAADPAVVAYNERVKETMSVTELKTLPAAAASKASLNIHVPVLEVVGQQDVLHCVHAVDCTSDASVLREEAPYFSPAARLQVEVIPGVGHDLNLHYAALAVYAQIMDWALAHVAP